MLKFSSLFVASRPAISEQALIAVLSAIVVLKSLVVNLVVLLFSQSNYFKRDTRIH
jgi:hypothetical protein